MTDNSDGEGHLLNFTAMNNEPFSPGGPLDWPGSAQWRGGDWAGAGVVRAGAARDSVF